jgi:hypothetical protein
VPATWMAFQGKGVGFSSRPMRSRPGVSMVAYDAEKIYERGIIRDAFFCRYWCR